MVVIGGLPCGNILRSMSREVEVHQNTTHLICKQAQPRQQQHQQQVYCCYLIHEG